MANKAAWIPAAKTQLKVSDAPEAVAGPDEVVIKNAALAVNPVDWKIQDYAFGVQKYPSIFGEDVAGEVVQVGKNVTRLKVGDRVLGYPIALATGDPKNAGFQLYSVVSETLTAPIPSSLPYTHAAVLPLSLATAAAGLYQPGFLELPYPTLHPKSLNKTLLIWGGASSVGSSAIQLAVASGVNVVATASKRNFEYVKSLGASAVVDYNDADVVEKLLQALKGTELAGVYDAISLEPSLRPGAEVLSKLGGGKIATVLAAPEGLPENVKTENVFAPTIATKFPEVGDAIFRKYVPDALKEGKLQAKPDPIVIEGGLEKVQEGLDRQRKGISAAKVVIAL